MNAPRARSGARRMHCRSRLSGSTLPHAHRILTRSARDYRTQPAPEGTTKSILPSRHPAHIIQITGPGRASATRGPASAQGPAEPRRLAVRRAPDSHLWRHTPCGSQASLNHPAAAGPSPSRRRHAASAIPHGSSTVDQSGFFAHSRALPADRNAYDFVGQIVNIHPDSLAGITVTVTSIWTATAAPGLRRE